MMSWPFAVLFAIDQLGNAVAGGNPDMTISARVGYWAKNAGKLHKWYWVMLEKVIDFTFYPLDGPGHCHQTYLSEKDEESWPGSDITRAILGLIVLAVCIPLSIVLRTVVFIVPAWRFKGNPTLTT